MLECSTSVISYCTDHNTYAAILYPGQYPVYCILVYYTCSWISPTLWLGSRSPSIRWSSSAGPETIKETVRSHYYYHVSGSEDARETSYINNLDNNHQRPRVKNHFNKFNWKFWGKKIKKKLKTAFRFLSLFLVAPNQNATSLNASIIVNASRWRQQAALFGEVDPVSSFSSSSHVCVCLSVCVCV